jgi:two-component system OmpR family sensor kinase
VLTIISLFFLFIFTLINALFWVALQYTQKRHEEEQLRRFFLAERVIHERDEITLKHLMIRPSLVSSATLLEKGEVIIELPFAKMVEYEGKTFFIHFPPPKPPFGFKEPHPDFMPPPNFRGVEVLEDVLEQESILLLAVVAGIDILILIFFAYLFRKLLPLYHLKNAIRLFKDGDTFLDAPSNGKDEISEVTKEFNLVLEKIASMREARSLFLRNVLHELKTPIMKGSLTCESLESSHEQERLNRIFVRMNYLLDEFAKIERFSSGAWSLRRVEYRFVDILDHAYDLLLCDRDTFTLKGEESGLIVLVDFELFAIALKNLLDNAMKYGRGKPTVVVCADSIEIYSLGDEMSEAKRDFSKPFNRAYEGSSTGLGLGLYLTNSIVQKHGFTLKYSYQDESNCFEICL